MSDDLEFIVIDDIPEYIFCIGDDEENEQVIAISGKDGAFKYEKVAELPTTGEDGVLYLVPKSHTTQTASGNPISVNITDGAGKIESLKLDGDTFQQTYTGKNLFDKNNASLLLDGLYVGSTTIQSSNQTASLYIPCEPNTTYTVSKDSTARFACATTAELPAGGVSIADRIADFTATSITITTSSTAKYLVVFYYHSSYDTKSKQQILDSIQIELGSTATAFEPYVGGQPSPNPSYPQDINVVTGTQTISINGTNYPLDLGDIQLCGLGDDGNGNPLYKDRIYRDGDDWKVHKELGNVTLDSTYYNSRYGTNSYGLTQFLVELGVSDYYDESGYVTMLSNPFTKQTTSFSNTQVQGFLPALDSNSHKLRAWIRISTTTADTIDQFKAWLNTNTPIFYYKLNTATDTAITDTTLITQLEAIRTAALESGSNTISNTATGTNLAGDLEIGYYSYDPLNKYDKYFWLDVDGEYESL